MRILLAEDDIDMMRFLQRALCRAGYDVVAVPDG
ncbi:MAG: response regulator, partial [Pseudomonadota bacterium]